MLSKLRSRVDQQYQTWLKRRIPQQSTIELNQKRLFIFPSKQGLFFLAVFLLVLIAAINFQNNLIYAMAFFMASLFNSAILFTFSNMSNLKLTIKKGHNNFLGEHIAFDIALSSSSKKKQHHCIKLFFKGQKSTEASMVSNTEEQLVRVFCTTVQRGYFEAPRLCIESVYPLGIIRCWTWVDLSASAIVYPKPMKTVHGSWQGDSDDGEIHSTQPGDDFHGLKTYQYGDSLTHAYWPSLAKGQRLQNKQFNSFVAEDHWLDFSQLHRGNIEETLSKLCFLAIELDNESQVFGLRMPEQTVALGSGNQHLTDVLSALALFEQSSLN